MGYELTYAMNTTGYGMSSMASSWLIDGLIICILVVVALFIILSILGRLPKSHIFVRILEFLGVSFHYFFKGLQIYVAIFLFFAAYIGMKGIGDSGIDLIQSIVVPICYVIIGFFVTASVGYITSKIYHRFKKKKAKKCAV